MAYRQDIKAGGFFCGRTASAVQSAQLPAGPFDVSRPRGENTATTLSDALITGLLIVYPVVATVVAVVVGLSWPARWPDIAPAPAPIAGAISDMACRHGTAGSCGRKILSG